MMRWAHWVRPGRGLAPPEPPPTPAGWPAYPERIRTCTDPSSSAHITDIVPQIAPRSLEPHKISIAIANSRIITQMRTTIIIRVKVVSFIGNNPYSCPPPF